jgi:hypothetical protein
MARSYKRDSNGRFAGGGGSSGGNKGSSGKGKSASKPRASRKATPATSKPKPRGIEARLQRSSMVQENYRRRAQYSGANVPGFKPMTPAKNQHIGKRLQQQRQAIANLYAKLTPSNRKRADTAMRRSGIMN